MRGETGVAVYCYDIETNSVEEKVFISTDISYGNVIQSLNKLAYYNVDQDTLYVMLREPCMSIRFLKRNRLCW